MPRAQASYRSIGSNNHPSGSSLCPRFRLKPGVPREHAKHRPRGYKRLGDIHSLQGVLRPDVGLKTPGRMNGFFLTPIPESLRVGLSPSMGSMCGARASASPPVMRTKGRKPARGVGRVATPTSLLAGPVSNPAPHMSQV